MRPSNTLLRTITKGDPDVRRVCGASGLTTEALEGKVKNLKNLITSLDQSIRELEQAERQERLGAKMVAIATLVVAGCDLIMDLVGKVPLSGKVVKALYKQKDSVVELTQGKADWAKIGKRTVDGVKEVVPISSVAKPLLGMGTKIADLGIDAARNELNEVKIMQFAVLKNAELIAWALEQEQQKPKAEVIKRLVAVAKASSALFDVLNGVDNASGLAAAKATTLDVSRRLKEQLSRVNAELEACAGESIVRPGLA